MWCMGFASMARLSDREAEALARIIEDCLGPALGEQSPPWTWDQAACAMDLDAAQLGRMRKGAEGFDYRRLLKLPDPVFSAFQARVLQRRNVLEDVTCFGVVAWVRAFMASRGLARMARVPVLESGEARKDRCA